MAPLMGEVCQAIGAAGVHPTVRRHEGTPSRTVELADPLLGAENRGQFHHLAPTQQTRFLGETGSVTVRFPWRRSRSRIA